jgi:hypothetical protein
MQLEQFKVHSQIELEQHKQQATMAMKEREFEQQSMMKDKEFEATSRLKEREFEHQKDMTQSEQEWQALLKDGEEGAKPRTGDGIKPPGGGARPSRFAHIVKEITEALAPTQVAAAVQPLQQALDQLRAQQNEPKRIIRDPKTGKAIAVETSRGTFPIERDPKTGKPIGIKTTEARA